MARTVLTLQEIVRTGLNPTYAAGDATNDHSFDNKGQDVVLHVKNGGGGAINVTIITSETLDGLAVADQVVNIPAGEERFIGPFRNDLYGSNDTDNLIDPAVFVDLDVDTSVTLAALQIGEVNF